LARGRRCRVIVRIAREGRGGPIAADLAGVVPKEDGMSYRELRAKAVTCGA
jgi:hypothetical protein